MTRVEHLAEGVTLYLGNMLEILPTIGPVDHVIQDPPYEAVMQNKWGALSSLKISSSDQGKLAYLPVGSTYFGIYAHIFLAWCRGAA